MLQRQLLTQQHTRSHWTIKIPRAMAATPPRFNLGEWVPLGAEFQNHPGVTLYGQIRGVNWYDGWSYNVLPPVSNPNCFDWDCPTEEMLIERIASLEI